jgi:hypothetical protein
MLACYTNFNLIVTTVLYLNLDYLKNPPLLFEDDYIPSDTLIGETAIS